MFDVNRRVAEALDVSPLALTLWIYIGFACLAVGGMAGITWLGYLGFAAGMGLLLVGVRAAGRTTRPVDLGSAAMGGIVLSTRALGVFYAVAGVVWMVLSWTVAQGG